MSTVQVGAEISFKEYSRVTKDLLKDYADSSGDDNAIHLDDEVARQRGLPGVIAHGMLIAGFVSSRCVEFLESDLEGQWELDRLQTRFKAMTFPGDTISVGGRIKKSDPDQIVLELKAVNQSQEVKVTANAFLKKS